ncbi:kinase-like protein [Neolentinus lepideus HHB14362 ss-1]|uniref:Kinase-like protein n=1 Tax=Neolentinus lepideus HHB14362 ss-1 TaxID=1314782 RepID=A0A165TKI2_9AGAM|nr:kinase-like protein [Neolentinus lepideus HHB14362 ss-1]
MSSLRQPLPIPDHCPNLSGQIAWDDKAFVGQGGFSNVYRGTWRRPPRDVPIVIKWMRFNADNSEESISQMKSTLREVNVWCNLRHENILPILGFCKGIAPGMPYELAPALVSPFCGNGIIRKYLDGYTGSAELQDIKIHLISGIAKGLHYLHSQGIVHGDLKPRNVLVSDEGTPLLADFGRAKILGKEGYTHTLVAYSLRYAAPEILDLDHDDSVPEFNQRSDMYSFGMLIYEVYTGRIPFYEITTDHKVSLEVVSHSRRPRRNDIPQDWWVLMQGCRDQAARLRTPIDAVVLSPLLI